MEGPSDGAGPAPAGSRRLRAEPPTGGRDVFCGNKGARVCGTEKRRASCIGSQAPPQTPGGGHRPQEAAWGAPPPPPNREVPPTWASLSALTWRRVVCVRIWPGPDSCLSRPVPMSFLHPLILTLLRFVSPFLAPAPRFSTAPLPCDSGSSVPPATTARIGLHRPGETLRRQW